jgi:hypothetical protein
MKFTCCIIVMVAGCALFHSAPQPKQPIEVKIVNKDTRCDILAPLPDEVIIVGFPTDEKIYVSKSDLINLMTYNAQIARWARTVNDCLRLRDAIK